MPPPVTLKLPEGITNPYEELDHEHNMLVRVVRASAYIMPEYTVPHAVDRHDVVVEGIVL